ncbi:MAG TPA: 30S ribosome-binding factor RbfA [Candidatus Paceibacterota bacterium]|nr:30S ribosome-binding factor RbfA [Candidatus Paceibacterota bacterium]
MRTHRPLRMGSVIREELAKIFLREMDFRGALVTITEVIVEKSYVWADVMISVLPASRTEAVLDQLTAAHGHLQHLLNKKMNVRPMPQIRFKADRGLENAARIEKDLIDEGISEAG